MTEGFDKEMEKIERQQNHLHNAYEQENKEYVEAEYKRELNATKMLPYAMEWKEPLQTYVVKLSAYVKIASELNFHIHVDNNGRGCWYTHKRHGSANCFMCQDSQMYRYLTNMLTEISTKYPKYTLS